METRTPAIYEKHHNNQQQIILERAEAYYITHGIGKNNFSSISSFCGITRSTLYRYFPSEENLLWAIHHKKMKEMGAALTRSFHKPGCTTLQRFRLYIDYFINAFEKNPDFFLFFDLFGKTYQAETAKHRPGTYPKYFLPGDFGSKDTVRFLSQDFHDGTVRSDLDPITTAVSITYSVLYTMVGFSKNHRELHLKYGIDCSLMVRSSCDLLLKGLC